MEASLTDADRAYLRALDGYPLLPPPVDPDGIDCRRCLPPGRLGERIDVHGFGEQPCEHVGGRP